MIFRKLPRIGLPIALLAIGIWLIGLAVNPAAETASRQEAIQAFAPASGEIVEAGDLALPVTQLSEPFTINLRDVPAGVLDPNNQLDRWRQGELDLNEQDGIRGEAQLAELRAESANLLPSLGIQEPTGPNPLTPVLGTNFDSMDYNECCGGGGNVPPDPELTVGPNHIIAVVNVALEIYANNGNKEGCI